MKKKINSILQYAKNMGPEWTLFRIQYELKRKTGYYSFSNKKILNQAERLTPNALSFSKPGIVNFDYRIITSKSEDVINKAENALQGKIFAFSHTYMDYAEANGRINWHLNPVLKVEAPRNIPWNKLPDFGPYGDIKLIWEASRFPQVFFLINAFSLTKDEKYARGCLQQIEHWIDNNPFPYGVNYKCGQEISFRLFAWILALDYFYDYLSPELTRKIVKNIYISLLRVAANIDFAAKSVKNNHSISEAAGLLIGGVLFPQLPESQKFIKKGIKYLQKELSYQVYDDGAYIQHSFNYQRLALDVLSFVIIIAKKNKLQLPEIIYTAHKKMIAFLSAFVQPKGFLPNYGQNDGSYLFPLAASHYRDFRESINLASAVHEPYTYFFKDYTTLIQFFNLKAKAGRQVSENQKFDTGGYYILKNKYSFSFIRCHSYKHRPAQSDMLHLDVWKDGINVFCDSGTFSYNVDKNFKRQFFGTIGHNTVMLNQSNQMEEILHFGWANWIKSKLIYFDGKTFEGEHYGYKKEEHAIHRRKVQLENNKIFITDTITGDKNSLIKIEQIWNSPLNFKMVSSNKFENEHVRIHANINGKKEEAYLSEYYNDYYTGTRIIFSVEAQLPFIIKTSIEIL